MTRKVTIFISILLFLSSVVYCQQRTITGKVIDETFLPISGASIFNEDTTLLTKTDNAGNFRIVLPMSANLIRLGAVGLEWKFIQLEDSCTYVEAILLLHSSYDFMPVQEVNRLRKKQFKKLKKLYADGVKRGILMATKPCYHDIFIPVKELQD